MGMRCNTAEIGQFLVQRVNHTSVFLNKAKRVSYCYTGYKLVQAVQQGLSAIDVQQKKTLPESILAPERVCAKNADT